MILVTGGTGMIGAHTARALADAGHDVVVTTHNRPRPPSMLDGRVAVERVDVTDREALLALGSRYGISAVVHLAGSIPPADPVAYFRTDMTALLNVLDAARAWQVRRFAVASSLGVYVGCSERPWREELALPTTALPHLIIAFKKAVEPLTLHALQGSDVQPVLLRIGTVWGPLVDPESPFFHIPPLVSAVLRGERVTGLRADAGGDACYAPDTGRAIAGLLTADVLRHEVYNVSSGIPFTNREVVDALRAVVPDAQVELVEDGPGTCADPYLDIGRLRADTGFAPAFDMRSAIADYVDRRRDREGVRDR